MPGGPSYEIVLGATAQLFVVTLGEPERKSLAEALRTELDGSSPNPRTRNYYGNVLCEHQVLVTGHTVVFNALTDEELVRLGREQRRKALGKGFFVYDILKPGYAIQAPRPGPRRP